jgi:hypothetical protein
MRDLNRRERNSENATARTSAAENAGFSVAAGTMALGAALSEDARAATPARADLAPNPALPAHETASREARADAPPPAPDEGGRTPDSPSQQAVNADAPLERPEQPPIARPQADAPTLDATAAPGNGGFDSGDATMNPVGPDSAATPAGSSSLPDTPFASRMSDTVTEDMAALFGRLSESSVELSSIVSTAVDDALDGIDRLADQVASAVESPNLPLIDQIGDAPVAPVLTWTAIDASDVSSGRTRRGARRRIARADGRQPERQRQRRDRRHAFCDGDRDPSPAGISGPVLYRCDRSARHAAACDEFADARPDLT